MANKQLKTALKEAGLTPDELAERLQVDPKTVRRWISGRAPYPRYRTQVAGMLGVHARQLWPQDGTGEPDGLGPELVAVFATADDGLPDWRALAASATRRVDLLDLTLGAVLRNEDDAQLLADAAARGCQVRVLLSDRDSAHLAIAEQEHGRTLSVSHRPQIVADLDRVTDLLRACALRREIELRTFVGAGAYRVLILDDQALITLRVPGTAAGASPTLHAVGREDGGLYDDFARDFETVWRTAEALR